MQKKDNRKKLIEKITKSVQKNYPKPTAPNQLTHRDLLKRDDLAPDVRAELLNYECRLTTRFEKGDKAEADFICEVIKQARWQDEELPASATAIVKNYMRHLAKTFDLMPWSEPEVARAAYQYVVDAQDGGLVFTPTMSFRGLRAAVQALCTAEEYKRFLVEGELTDDSAPPAREESDYAAAEKAALLLADPRTTKATKQALSIAIGELANATDVQATHPALAERALTVMFESMKKRQKGIGSIPNRRDAYTQVIGLLSTIEEGGAK